MREKEIFRKDKELEEVNERLTFEQEEKDDLKRRILALEEAVIVKNRNCIINPKLFREKLTDVLQYRMTLEKNERKLGKHY